MTYKDTHERTSSPASEDGITRSNSPGGQLSFQFGPEVVPASLSAPPARAEGSTTSATFGQSGSDSSRSVDPLSSLASRLSARLAVSGGTLYRRTWKVWDTPQGRSIYALRASAHRTSGNGCSGWPTPTAATNLEGPEAAAKEMSRQTNGGGGRSKLTVMSHIAGWPTPTAGTPNSLRGTGQDPEKRKAGGHQVGIQDAVHLAGWATPTAAQLGNTLENYTAMKANMKSGKRTAVTHLNLQTELIGWATPTARDHKDGAAEGTAPTNALLGRQAWLTHEGPVVLRASGPDLTGYTAETVNGDRLSPEHSRWLMGYPAEWASCAPTETRSFLKRRQP